LIDKCGEYATQWKERVDQLQERGKQIHEYRKSTETEAAAAKAEDEKLVKQNREKRQLMTGTLQELHDAFIMQAKEEVRSYEAHLRVKAIADVANASTPASLLHQILNKVMAWREDYTNHLRRWQQGGALAIDIRKWLETVLRCVQEELQKAIDHLKEMLPHYRDVSIELVRRQAQEIDQNIRDKTDAINWWHMKLHKLTQKYEQLKGDALARKQIKEKIETAEQHSKHLLPGEIESLVAAKEKLTAGLEKLMVALGCSEPSGCIGTTSRAKEWVDEHFLRADGCCDRLDAPSPPPPPSLHPSYPSSVRTEQSEDMLSVIDLGDDRMDESLIVVASRRAP